nr:PD-(D/E)XK nuclease family protein [bacterium]
EWPFGRGSDRPLFIPVAGDSPASISGRIDRVDSGDGDESFLVIDYKTGASGPVTGDIKKGLHLQLPLYVDAAARLLFPNARPLGGLIVDVKNAQPGGEDETPGKSHGFVRKSAAGLSFRIGRKKSTLGEEEFEAAIESARKSAARCIEGIRAGKFSPRPNEYCRNCNHADICRQKDMASD